MLPDLSDIVRVSRAVTDSLMQKIRDYGIFISQWPAILGSDAAGQVVVVGAEVKHLAIGDRVFFQGIIGNYDCSTFQQYCKIPAALAGKIPTNISDDEASGIALATVAAVTGAYDKTGQGLTPPPWEEGGDKIGHGKAAVILGGSSSVGQYAIQLARLSGFERIITNSSAAHVDHLKTLGATVVLDRSSNSAMDFKEAAGNLEVAFIQDAISTTETQILGVKILQALNGGNVITVLGVDDDAVKMGQQDGEKAVHIKQVVGIGSSPALLYLSEPLMKALGGENGWLARGEFLPNRTEVVDGGLRALDRALEKNKRGVSGVKVVIRPHDVERRLI